MNQDEQLKTEFVFQGELRGEGGWITIQISPEYQNVFKNYMLNSYLYDDLKYPILRPEQLRQTGPNTFKTPDSRSAQWAVLGILNLIKPGFYTDKRYFKCRSEDSDCRQAKEIGEFLCQETMIPLIRGKEDSGFKKIKNAEYVKAGNVLFEGIKPRFWGSCKKEVFEEIIKEIELLKQKNLYKSSSDLIFEQKTEKSNCHVM